MTFVTFFIIFFISTFISESDLTDEKRILLNDPNLLQSEFRALQRDLQDLKSSVETKRQEVASLTNELKAVQAKNLNLTHEVASLQSQNGNFKRAFDDMEGVLLRSGSVYTTWGKRTCPNRNGMDIIYSGLIGGSSSSEPGNGVNTLCLPHDPEALPDHVIPLVQATANYGHLFGAEYHFSFNKVVIHDDVPCAVCLAKMSATTLMFPAKRTCPPSWIKQYSGFLGSNYYDYGKNEYLCLDENPDYIERSRENLAGLFLYPVKSVCGSLPCPPYKNSTLISCVVCSLK